MALWLFGWSENTLASTEWTIAGNELGRRRWFSRPGSKPSVVMGLGPQIEIVHESWSRWRVTSCMYAIDVRPWRTKRLIEAMERAGVRVNDWRGDWARRHRLLNGLGLLTYCGGAVRVFAAAALGSKPGNDISLVLLLASVGAFVVGLAIDFLPWWMKGRPLPGGGRA